MLDEASVGILSAILASLCKRPNLFILGAGASYPDSPTTGQLKSVVIPQWLRVGSYPISQGTRADTFERVIGTLDNSAFDHRKKFYLNLLRTNPNALDWLISYQLSIDKKARVPPNYAVFWKLPSRSVILNYNLDQYANHLRPYHVVLEPHGCIPVNLRQVLSEKDINEYAEYEIPTPWQNETLLIRQEHYRILKSKDYLYLMKNWALFRDVIMIGYSFSRFRETIDDFATFEFLCEMIKYHRNQVILIDPYPDHTADMVQSEIGRRILVGVFKWNKLSVALLSTMGQSGISSIYRNANNILRKYRELY